MSAVDETLSFEILPNYQFAYSAGLFGNLESAQDYASHLRHQGFLEAQVNKFLNGQRVAMLDEMQLFAYVNWMEEY